MFVPTADKLQLVTQPAFHQAIAGPSTLHMPPQNVEADHPLQDHVLLTGFTLGREHEWRKRVWITIKTCIVSCKVTFSAEVYAGFAYGLGLRFPIKVGGLYSYRRHGDKETASIAPVFEPINGSEADYASTGLEGDKIFHGQELVAEADAYAGLNFHLPFYSDGIQKKIGADLTDELPAPFAHGQFTPPAPGAANTPEVPVIFSEPDLLGGLANYGVIGAKVLPAVKLGLISNSLRLQLKDNLSGQVTEMDTSGRTYPLAVQPGTHESNFTIGQPEYNLAFHITPGLDARLFVDVSVWSDHWDWTAWFPQISVTLPPDGATFRCHEKTTCSYNYLYSPTDASDTPGPDQPPDDPLEKEVFDWQQAFQKKWFDICPSMPLQFCQVAILGVMKTIGNQMEGEMKAQPKYPSNETAMIVLKKAIEADKQAKAIVLEAKVAMIDRRGKDLFKVYEPFWSNGCADQLCRDRIHALGGPYVNALMARQKAKPDLGENEVVFEENTQGKWAQKARAEVEASKKRAERLVPAQRIRTVPGVRFVPPPGGG
jgi:hypothetical protein